MDVLGFRQVDQKVEKDWVSGITTISNRARYLSLIPWLVAEYYKQHGIDQDGKVAERDEAELIALTRRLEMVVLASTRHTDSKDGHTTGGLIGPGLFEEEMADLEAKGEVRLDLERGGASYGTYAGPCRAFGLLAYESLPGSWAPKQTPRTKRLLECRRELAGAGSLAGAVLNGDALKSDAIAKEAHLFSAGALGDDRCANEREILVEALFAPEPTQDHVAYDRFRRTVRMVLQAVGRGEGVSAKIIARTYVQVVCSDSFPVAEISLLWATYELHRRVHFALELLLSATTQVVIDEDGATTAQVVQEWTTADFPPELGKYVDASKFGWSRTLGRFIACVNDDPFLAGPVERAAGRQMPSAGAKAVFAMALLCATWRQTRPLMKHYHKLHGRGAAILEVFPLIDKMADWKLDGAVQKLTDRCVVEAHLNATLRKMAHGMKCSLRFFPDGRTLRPTGMTIEGGYSADRLGNVIGILTDLGFIRRGSPATLTRRGTDLLHALGESDAE